MRSLFADFDHSEREPARIQDPYGLRVYPVAQASVVASLHSLAGQVERTLNSAQENPLFDVEGDRSFITARSIRRRCRSNWTDSPWRSR